MIRSVTKRDVEAICTIYNHYVENTIISFEEKPISTAEMSQRIESVQHQFPWIVFEENGKVMAYAYANHWKTRSAYRYTLETTVYASKDLKTKGVGTALYTALFAQLRETNTAAHSLMAVIALPNDASVGLHEKMGFNKVAHFSQVGYKLNQWIDVGYWQMIFNAGK